MTEFVLSSAIFSSIQTSQLSQLRESVDRRRTPKITTTATIIDARSSLFFLFQLLSLCRLVVIFIIRTHSTRR